MLLRYLLLPALALASPALPQRVVVERVGPILDPAIVGDHSAYNFDRESDEAPFVSIAGPSLIRVPDWVEDPLGRYYLYFAHHKGGHIRLAYADELAGPWTVYQPGRGVLRLADLRQVVQDHIASPDVHVDDEQRRITMYFHGPRRGAAFDQRTWVATSEDGLGFRLVTDEILGEAYFRVFRWGGYEHAVSRLGPVYRSRDGFHNFEPGPTLFGSSHRHFAVKVADNRAFVFYSKLGDAPERLKMVTLDLSPDWSTWAPSQEIEVLAPTEDWEKTHGAKLLDPCIYEEDGRHWLLYSFSQERGIALARLHVAGWEELNVSRIRARSGAAYRVADEGFGPGARPWVDSEGRVTSSPPDLLDLPYLLTAQADVRSNPFARFLRFHVNRPVRAIVAHDGRHAEVPHWLADWTRTGGALQVMDETDRWSLDLYERDFPAGEIVLGGNVPDGEALQADRSMYAVLLRPR